MAKYTDEEQEELESPEQETAAAEDAIAPDSEEPETETQAAPEPPKVESEPIQMPPPEEKVEKPESSDAAVDKEVQEANKAEEEASAAAPKEKPKKEEQDPELARLQALLNTHKELKKQKQIAQDPEESELSRLQAQQKAGMLTAALLQGSSKIAQGLAMKYGANPGDNLEGVKTVQEMAKQPVQDYLTNQANVLKQVNANKNNAMMQLYGQKAQQIQAANSPLPPAVVKYLQLDWMKKNPNADKADMPKFEEMTPTQLKQLGVGSNTAKLSAQTKILPGPDGRWHQFQYNPITQRYDIDAGLAGTARTQTAHDAEGNLITVNAPNGPVRTVPGGTVAPPPAKETSEQTAAKGQSPAAAMTLATIRQTSPIAAKAVEKEQAAMFGKDSLLKKLRDAGYREDLFNAKLIPTQTNPDGTFTVDSGMAPAIRAQMAALAVGGVPGEHAMSEFGGAGGLANKIDRLVQGTVSGKVTQQDLDFYKKYSEIMHNTIQNSANKAAQIHIDNVMSQFPPNAITRDQAADLLGVKDLIPSGSNVDIMQDKKRNRWRVDHSTKKVLGPA